MHDDPDNDTTPRASKIETAERRPRTLADLTAEERAALATKIRETAKDADARSLRLIEIRGDHARAEDKVALRTRAERERDQASEERARHREIARELLASNEKHASEIAALRADLLADVERLQRQLAEEHDAAARLSSLQAAIVATAPDPKREAWIAEVVARVVASHDVLALADPETDDIASLIVLAEVGIAAGYVDATGNLKGGAS